MNRAATIFILLLFVFVTGTAIAQTNSTLPPLPRLRSPVDTFRELLNMTSAERMSSLADRSPETRQRLLDKVREYQQLSADERELRLRATELRWWLLSLMRQPAAQDAAALAMVPEHLRSLVKDRLERWRLLPEPLQQEFLANEDAAQLFARVQGLSPSQRERILSSLSPERRQLLERGLDRWTNMSADERQQTTDRFDQFFTLNDRERQRVLSTLSDTERQQLAQTLKAFDKLPREQRLLCVKSFEKFANMSVAERQLFLKKAEVWENMPAEERERWRNLVKSMPELPPVPAGFYDPTPPPLPPGVQRMPMTPPSTNGG